jgi:hypothetical protein
MSQPLWRFNALAVFAVLAAMVSPLAPVASAVAATSTVFSNLGPGDSFSTIVGWTLGDAFGNSHDVGGSFTNGSTAYLLDSVDMPLGRNIDSSLALSVQLWSNVANVPGALLATGDTITSINTPGARLNHVTFSSPFVLQPDTKYWLVADAQPTFGGYWAQNITDDLELSFRVNNGSWSGVPADDAPAFRINGIVPTPTASASTFAVLAAFTALRKRRVFYVEP